MYVCISEGHGPYSWLLRRRLLYIARWIVSFLLAFSRYYLYSVLESHHDRGVPIQGFQSAGQRKSETRGLEPPVGPWMIRIIRYMAESLH